MTLSCEGAARSRSVRGGLERSGSAEYGSAVEEESGIGERMTRTMTKAKKRKATGAGKRKAAKAGMESPSKVHELSDGLTAEGMQVVVQMTEKALHGDAKSADAVVDQANESAGEAEAGASPARFSQALAWASEPEWQGESSEEATETASGSREPDAPFD